MVNKYINETILFVPVKRKHRHRDGEVEKIQAAQLGIELRASGYAHQRSDHWAIVPQQQLHWTIHPSSSTDVSATLLGNCRVAVHSQQRPAPWVVMWCTNLQQINQLGKLILTVKQIHQSNHSFCTRQKKALTSGRRSGKNSGSATGDRTQGLWLCAPALWPLSYHAAAATALNHPLLDIYRCQHYTGLMVSAAVGCRLQHDSHPTV